jgi:hypothetical protein
MNRQATGELLRDALRARTGRPPASERAGAARKVSRR